MCDNPTAVWLVKYPKRMFGNFVIRTRQYNERVQISKEYILFKSKQNSHYTKRFNHVQTVWLPCGKCAQCLQTRSNSWTIRSSLELQKYTDACALTLTYDNDNLPDNAHLRYKDIQLFLKKLRNRTGKKIKFMCACEYGRKNLRPHYHIIIFGYHPDDIPQRCGQPIPYKITSKRSPLFKSRFINKLWGKGFVDVGLVNHQTCRYVSQYCCKKLLNRDKSYIDKCKDCREKLVASVGFGLDWFKRNYRSVIESGRIVLGGFKFSIPQYFIRKLQSIDKNLFDDYTFKRHQLFLSYKFDDDEKRKMQARSERILGRLKIFQDKNIDDSYLLAGLHNMHYQYLSLRKKTHSKPRNIHTHKIRCFLSHKIRFFCRIKFCYKIRLQNSSVCKVVHNFVMLTRKFRRTHAGDFITTVDLFRLMLCSRAL